MTWCKDIERDAAVRAAEDGRTGPLPTLGEAIAGPFADAAERSSTVSKTGDGQSGMRTERITLEVTRPAIPNYPAPAKHWMWQHLLRDIVQGDRESVRVVDEPSSEAEAEMLRRSLVASEMRRLREERRWVPVGERLPEHGDSVWVFDGTDVVIGEYWGTWQSYGASCDREGLNSETLLGITHWTDIRQPLPPGPEGDGNG